jgi:hypothetical protein
MNKIGRAEMAPGRQLDLVERLNYGPNARSCDLKESGEGGTSWARSCHVATAPLSRISMRRKMIVLQGQLIAGTWAENQRQRADSRSWSTPRQS